MNDLWAYDIKQCQYLSFLRISVYRGDLVSSDKQHKWEQIQYNSPAPPRRTGHILVSSSGKLYLSVVHFGETRRS